MVKAKSQGKFAHGLVAALTMLEMADDEMLRKLDLTPTRRDEMTGLSYRLNKVDGDDYGVRISEKKVTDTHAAIAYPNRLEIEEEPLYALHAATYALGFIKDVGTYSDKKPWTIWGLHALKHGMTVKCMAFQDMSMRFLLPQDFPMLPVDEKRDYINNRTTKLREMKSNFSIVKSLRNRFLRGAPDTEEKILLKNQWEYDELATGCKTWRGAEWIENFSQRVRENERTPHFDILDYGT